MDIGLVVSSFIAGLLTFFAPCTLPLVPGFLVFISGTSLKELSDVNKKTLARKKVVLNAVLYCVGFSVVFIVLGTLVSFGGVFLIPYKLVLQRLGGLLIIVFGLSMMGLPWFSFFNTQHASPLAKYIHPGGPLGSLLFGMAFASGWTPCVGPILGTILTLAATTSTVGKGIVLLSIFSLGLAIPFMLVAFGIGSAIKIIGKLSGVIHGISMASGVLLIILGVLLCTNTFSAFTSWIYILFDWFHYGSLLNYL